MTIVYLENGVKVEIDHFTKYYVVSWFPGNIENGVIVYASRRFLTEKTARKYINTAVKKALNIKKKIRTASLKRQCRNELN